MWSLVKIYLVVSVKICENVDWWRRQRLLTKAHDGQLCCAVECICLPNNVLCFKALLVFCFSCGTMAEAMNRTLTTGSDDATAATARCQMYTVHKDEQIETLLQNEDRLATIELTTDQSMTGMRVCFQYLFSLHVCSKICISKHIINYISCRVTNTDSVFLNLFFC